MPRLASARGEEKARRAMPTRSGADPGGSRVSGPLSRWLGTSGNKVGVGSTLRPRGAFLWQGRFSEAVGIEVAVAITRLAKHGASISLFVRFVKNYVRILFAFYGLKFAPIEAEGQVTLETAPARRPANATESRTILDRLKGSGTWPRSAF